jgi:hypothetical protein
MYKPRGSFKVLIKEKNICNHIEQGLTVSKRDDGGGASGQSGQSDLVFWLQGFVKELDVILNSNAEFPTFKENLFERFLSSTFTNDNKVKLVNYTLLGQTTAWSPMYLATCSGTPSYVSYILASKEMIRDHEVEVTTLGY